MTFSILARDPVSGAIGGAAATGSLCVGGWVLRGDWSAGMSASQGAAPSIFWGEDVLAEMRSGTGAAHAVEQITAADAGREFRQLIALDMWGQTGAFTGTSNEPAKGSVTFDQGIVSGNLLASVGVLDAMTERFIHSKGGLDHRLLSTLRVAAKKGGDSRGLLSAALLVLYPDKPPLSLRIDYHPDDPIKALDELHEKATTGAYSRWAQQVPTPNDRERTLD